MVIGSVVCAGIGWEKLVYGETYFPEKFARIIRCVNTLFIGDTEVVYRYEHLYSSLYLYDGKHTQCYEYGFVGLHNERSIKKTRNIFGKCSSRVK